MSQTMYMDPRDRWSARSVILRKWLTDGREMRYGSPVCELEIDGAQQIYHYGSYPPGYFTPGEYGSAYWAYVQEGNEVGPRGSLMEFSTSGWLKGFPRLNGPVRSRYVRRERYPRVFLSYRREDTEAYAGRLHESLSGAFGPDNVFMDLFSIPPGEPYEWAIQQAVSHCEALVALIGPKWSSVQDKHGLRRRMDSDWDLVRREVCAALDRGVPVVPVLTPGTSIPAVSDLPPDLEGLESLQCLFLTARHWRSDVETLVTEPLTQLGAT